MEKEQLASNIWYCVLWSRKYSNYSQTSFIRTTLFRQKISVKWSIRKIVIRPVATGSIRGKSPLNFFCRENYLWKTITKQKSRPSKNVLLAWP